jgi:hypothetical protein
MTLIDQVFTHVYSSRLLLEMDLQEGSYLEE